MPKQGYLDILRPHAANQILVGDLGSREILLIACDDGDVIGYYTRSILNAIENLEGGVPPYPFFLQNVGLSAWGLAIHTASRLIAVSSNTHKILVFAFALANARSRDSRDIAGEWKKRLTQFGGSFMSFSSPLLLREEGDSDMINMNPKYRYWDLVLCLSGHRANVPNIHFWNNDTDEHDVFLAGIDIDRRIWAWDVWNGHIVVGQEAYNDSRSRCELPRSFLSNLY